MRTYVNPVDNLTLPTPPEGHYWRVFNDSFIGPMMGLYKRRRRWFDSKVEYRSPTEMYSDGTLAPLNVGLEHAAEVIMERIQTRQDYFKQVADLYDPKTSVKKELAERFSSG